MRIAFGDAHILRPIFFADGASTLTAGTLKRAGEQRLMKKMMLAVCMFGCFATTAFAQGMKMPAAPTMTTEQRQKMADAHEKMAACLRSERTVADCHEEMMKSCKENMGANCPMMGRGMGPMKHRAR